MLEESDCISRFFENDGSVSPTANMSQTSIDSGLDDLSLSQLTIHDPEPLNVPPFYNITPREIPTSPHAVLEEEFTRNPWAMLVATIFLTKTSGKAAKPYMKAFFDDYPTPYCVLDSSPDSLERYFENLGLRKRGCIIWKLTYQFVSCKWRRASDLYGIGKYGEDAYRIFCLGHTDLDPDDRYLKLYLDWLRRNTDFMETNGAIDSEYVMDDLVAKYYEITLRN
ncbi:unnamed protein product [Leptidea sinapis]|uniref:HhH-GPD domain-containing protein n=1 Tax=Leptidea sinapis TaxID=189913 RepID=A0A5E4Q5P8_9NEOP|nr:unnamed protein product [Leptidea sinapis]